MKNYCVLPAAFLLAGFAFQLSAAEDQRQSPEPKKASLQREAYFGDLHLHTGYSFDAYMGGVRVGPDEAYRFARGETVEMAGEPVKRTTPPLDFLAVADHAEWMGIPQMRESPSTSAAMTQLLREWRKEKGHFLDPFMKFGWPSRPKLKTDEHIEALTQSAWRRQVEAANRHYQPGKFTTLIGYEWTSAPVFPDGVGNLHRVVVFAGGSPPVPFTSIDSAKPEDLWAFLERCRAQGNEGLAIPHNGNLSRGMMFDELDSDGRPINQTYAALRAANEPLAEIVQQKGQSETRPDISVNDEFASFEVIKALFSRDIEKDENMRDPRGYVRPALSRGLKLAEQAGGINPFKYGFVGASDAHNGQGDSSEAQALPLSASSVSSPGLTGVWAEQNTREAIFAALRRKEAFATSGTRMKLRFFGGWGFSKTLLENRGWVTAAYRDGVPMGGDLPSRPSAARAPTFLLTAVKDPDGANLDRIQVVKVWLENGAHAEKIYDVALSNGRKLDPKTGKAPALKSTVDERTATYTNTIGTTELSAWWTDPQFDSNQAAVYYMRVIEIPTPRWTTIVAAKTGGARPKDVPATIQERGWSSPVWYSPPASSTTR